MRLLFHSIPAALAAVLFSAATSGVPASASAAEVALCASQPTAVEWHARLAGMAPAERSGLSVAVEVDLAHSADFSLDAEGFLHYGMLFNDVAEGWSWQPESRPDSADYYRWKFFPLQTVGEEGASYVQEEKIGSPQLTRVERRHDYFLAFDNPYRFYVRGDTGFAVRLNPIGRSPGADMPLPPAVRLVAVARLGEPATADSSTFWKAVHARPVDFTLKKHYLIGALEVLVVCDAHGARELARIEPLSQR